MRVEVVSDTPMWFGPGVPVRAASAIAPFGDGWLVAQDDATHAAWLRPGGSTGPPGMRGTAPDITAIRVIDAVGGHETFDEASNTKHLKPDFEAAVPVDGGVLLLGSGSTPRRMRVSLLTATGGLTTTDLTPLYHRVAHTLGIPVGRLNLEGAARLGDRLRWFQRGNAAAGIASASVDVDLAALITDAKANSLAEADSTARADSVAEADSAVGGHRLYDLGTVGGVALAVTDAVALPDGRMVVSAAAEDTPNAVDDGPVVGAAIALLDLDGGVRVGGVPGGPYKIEGLGLRESGARSATLIAVVDADDPVAASRWLELRVTW